MIIDLTMPIADHFRWPVQRELKQSFDEGHNFQVTWMGWGVHGFTHVDAPRHMLPDGATNSDLDLQKVVGKAAIIDLSSQGKTCIAPNTEIRATHLEAAGSHVPNHDEHGQGALVLLKTAWDTVVSPQTPDFWATAPYMSRDACEWLLARNIRAIGFDFPQDYPIRGMLPDVNMVDLLGREVTMQDMVTHDMLLRQGIILIEYLCNLGAVTGEFVDFYALPLRIPDADGAPARAIAMM